MTAHSSSFCLGFLLIQIIKPAPITSNTQRSLLPIIMVLNCFLKFLSLQYQTLLYLEDCDFLLVVDSKPRYKQAVSQASLSPSLRSPNACPPSRADQPRVRTRLRTDSRLTHILSGPSWTKTLNKATCFLGSDRHLITKATWARPQPHGQLSVVYVLEPS